MHCMHADAQILIYNYRAWNQTETIVLQRCNPIDLLQDRKPLTDQVEIPQDLKAQAEARLKDLGAEEHAGEILKAVTDVDYRLYKLCSILILKSTVMSQHVNFGQTRCFDWSVDLSTKLLLFARCQVVRLFGWHPVSSNKAHKQSNERFTLCISNGSFK